MISQEQAKKIEEIYNEAINKLKKLDKERKGIVSNYIKELESQKIDAIRASILLDNK
jgi:mRNA-degrading endonuclease RelE of RelBE toxin-antitoxin system